MKKHNKYIKQNKDIKDKNMAQFKTQIKVKIYLYIYRSLKIILWQGIFLYLVFNS